MENKMEATIVYWGYIGIMEIKMEATIVTGSAQIAGGFPMLGVPCLKNKGYSL